MALRGVTGWGRCCRSPALLWLPGALPCALTHSETTTSLLIIGKRGEAFIGAKACLLRSPRQFTDPAPARHLFRLFARLPQHTNYVWYCGCSIGAAPLRSGDCRAIVCSPTRPEMRAHMDCAPQRRRQLPPPHKLIGPQTVSPAARHKGSPRCYLRILRLRSGARSFHRCGFTPTDQ
jgi:hypothetical protein